MENLSDGQHFEINENGSQELDFSDLPGNSGYGLSISGLPSAESFADGNVLDNIVLNSDGTGVFNTGTDFDRLKEGETKDITYEYSYTKADGGTADSSFTITITGENDAPRLKEGIDNITIFRTEDQGLKIDQSLINEYFIDPEGDDISIIEVEQNSPTYTYLYNNGRLSPEWISAEDYFANPDKYELEDYVDSLQQGDGVTERFTLIVEDESGDSGSAILELNISGVDDSPKFASSVLEIEAPKGEREIKDVESLVDNYIFDPDDNWRISSILGHEEIEYSRFLDRFYMWNWDYDPLDENEEVFSQGGVLLKSFQRYSDKQLNIFSDITFIGINDVPELKGYLSYSRNASIDSIVRDAEEDPVKIFFKDGGFVNDLADLIVIGNPGDDNTLLLEDSQGGTNTERLGPVMPAEFSIDIGLSADSEFDNNYSRLIQDSRSDGLINASTVNNFFSRYIASDYLFKSSFSSDTLSMSPFGRRIMFSDELFSEITETLENLGVDPSSVTFNTPDNDTRAAIDKYWTEWLEKRSEE